MIVQNGEKQRFSLKENRLYFGGDNMGPAKLEKARQLGVKIIDEEAFLRLLVAH